MILNNTELEKKTKNAWETYSSYSILIRKYFNTEIVKLQQQYSLGKIFLLILQK